MKEERYRIAHHDVRIFSNKSGTDWDVWLEPNDGELHGVCIGGGATRDAAVQCAVEALEAALTTLQETPSPEAAKKMAGLNPNRETQEMVAKQRRAEEKMRREHNLLTQSIIRGD